MADIKLLADTALQTVIDDNATLADAARAAGDYDNGTALDLEAVAYLTVQYDTGPPSAGDVVAELYVLPGDGETTEVFPDGGGAGAARHHSRSGRSDDRSCARTGCPALFPSR